MSDEVLKVEPATIVFTGAAGSDAKAQNKLTNSGASKLAVKVKVNNGSLNVARPFFTIDPGQSTTMRSQCKGLPADGTGLAVAIYYADAPTDMGADRVAMQTAWASITEPKTIRLTVEIKSGDAAPAEPAAAAEGGEAPAAEGGACE